MERYQLGVNRAGRPYRLYPADPGREFRSELLPMPPITAVLASLKELGREAGLPEAVLLRAEEIMVQAFARGATIGYSRGLSKRNELLARLAQESMSPGELREVAQLSDSGLRKLLREEGVPAATPGRSARWPVVSSKARVKKGK